MSEWREPSLILAAGGVQQAVLTRLAERYRIIGPLSVPLSNSLAALDEEQRSCVRVLLTIGSVQVSRASMGALPNLGLIACTGAGYEGIDVDGATELGIRITNSPGISASSVADIAIALLIASVRGILDANAKLRSQGLSKPWPATKGLTGRRVGIYGLGKIGAKVARRLSALEVRIGYCSRRRHPNAPYRHFEKLLALADWADALVVCVPATAETIGSVDERVLAALGRDGHLINVGRGSVVNTAALCEALTRHTIAGAGLDVFDPAFLPQLLAFTNVVLTPHIGGATEQAEDAMSELVRCNVDAFLSGRNPPTQLPQDIVTPHPART